MKRIAGEKGRRRPEEENLTDEEWETLCRQCGQCCFEKWVEGDGTVHPTPIPCRFLDIVDRRCKVYHKRFDVDEGCVKLSADLVREVNWLPEDCAYVQRFRKGR